MNPTNHPRPLIRITGIEGPTPEERLNRAYRRGLIIILGFAAYGLVIVSLAFSKLF